MATTGIGFIYPHYRFGCGKKVQQKWIDEASNYQTKSMKPSTKGKRLLDKPNQKLSVRLLSNISKCRDMDFDIGSVIQDELERLEKQENQLANESEAEQASA